MPFKPGESGNPGGRPKNSLQEFLRNKDNLPKEIYEAVHPLLKSKKEATRIWAAEFLRDTRDGKPTQLTMPVDAKGQYKPYNITVKIDNAKIK